LLILEILRVAVDAMLANKLRSLLTMLGIVIGIAAVITMLALGEAAQRNVQAQLRTLGTNVLTVRPGQAFFGGVAQGADAKLTVEDAQALQEGRGVQAVAPELEARYQVEYSGQNANISIVGSWPSYFDVNNYHLAAGRVFSDAEDRLNHWEIPEDSSNPELDHADSASNTPHNFVGSATWNIPGKGAALSNWRVSGVVHAQSGNPYTIRYAQDITGTTQVFCTAQRTCNVTTPEGRNTARSAAVRYADLTLTRTFVLTGRNRVEVRADVFNLFNNENYTADGYIGILGNANFGKPTSGAYPGRQFQFGAIYRF